MIKYDGRQYTFDGLMKKVMREKGWSEARARRYVGEIQARQEHTGKHKQ